MPTECNPKLFEFAPVEGRQVVAAFDGGAITSDAGALLLGQTDRAIRLTERFAVVLHRHACGGTGGAQRRHDGDAAGGRHRAGLRGPERPRRTAARSGAGGAGRQAGGAAVGLRAAGGQVDAEPAGTEPTGADAVSQGEPRSRRRSRRCSSICSWTAHRRAPEQIILDLDATDDPLHGHQEGRFFHGYYDCYCYLPLYIFCGRHLLAAKLRRSNIDGAAGAIEEVARIVAQIRRRWPRVRILLRGDSGFAREALMAWCEANRVDFLFGLARNERLEEAIKAELMTRGAGEHPDRQAGAPLQGLHLVDAGQLEPQPPRRRQGRGDPAARPIRALSSPR